MGLPPPPPVARVAEVLAPRLPGFLVQKVSRRWSSSSFGEAGGRVVTASEMGLLITSEGRRFPGEPQEGCRTGGWGLPRSARPALPDAHLPGGTVRVECHVKRGRGPSSLQTSSDLARGPISVLPTPSSVSPSCFRPSPCWDFDLQTIVEWHQPKNCFPKPEPRCCLHPGGA